MTTKRTSKSAAHRAAKRRQMRPITPASMQFSPLTPQPQLFKLEVVRGKGSGEYAAGTMIPIEADVPSQNEIFTAWHCDELFVVADILNTITTVTMPDHDVTVEARFEPIPTTAPLSMPPQQPKSNQWLPWVIAMIISAIIVAAVLLGGSFVRYSREVAQATPTEVAAPTVEPTATVQPTQVATPVATMAPAVPEAAVPAGFAENKDAIVVTDQNTWPAKDPTNGAAGQFVVTACQNPVAVYNAAAFETYTEATGGCLTGVLWFEPQVVQNIPTAQPTAAPAATTVATDSLSVELGVCTKEESREARLDCATKYYFDFGQKLTGIKAYMRSLGAEWNEIKIGDPFQPSADALQSGSPRIWGAVLKATNLKVTGKSCLVTDVPSRIGSYKWVYVDKTYNPRPSVWHAGEAVTTGKLIEIAFHGDCSDWPEIEAVMTP